MSFIVIKTIKGRQYCYLQRSYREGGRVRTESLYLGPVSGGRRKGVLKSLGKLVAANRAEPGLRLTERMVEESQRLAAARAKAQGEADDAFYVRMHALYGMTKGAANPVPIEKTSSPFGPAASGMVQTSGELQSEVGAAQSQQAGATESPSAAEAAAGPINGYISS